MKIQEVVLRPECEQRMIIESKERHDALNAVTLRLLTVEEKLDLIIDGMHGMQVSIAKIETNMTNEKESLNEIQESVKNAVPRWVFVMVISAMSTIALIFGTVLWNKVDTMPQTIIETLKTQYNITQ